MQQTAAAAAGGAAQGCYKCGQKGHWSRDCTVPQSQWIPRQPGQQCAFGGGGAVPATAAVAALGDSVLAGEHDAFRTEQDAAEAAPAGQTAAALRKQKRKRPKLTLELLQGHKGLPDVLVNFPDAFRSQFKGRGHEANDLRRLLEMYKRWQDRVFPHGEFDAFICSLERLSGTNAAKHYMHETRVRLLKEVQDIADPPHLQLEDQAEPAGLQAGGAAPAGMASLGAREDDELELLIEEQDEFDHPELDDELLGMLEEDPAGPGGAALGTAGASRAAPHAGVDDDDAFMELLEEVDDEEEEDPARLAAVPAQQQQEPGVAAAAAGEEFENDLFEEEDQLVALAADNSEHYQPSQSLMPPSIHASAQPQAVFPRAEGASQPQLSVELEPSLQLGASPVDKGMVVPAAEDSVQPSPLLKEGTENEALAFEPSPLLGANTEEQLAGSEITASVPETEQVGSATQEL